MNPQSGVESMRFFDRLTLKRLGDDRPAGLWLASLPWPRTAAKSLSLNGASTYQRQLGQWPESPDGFPRRLLLIADGGDTPAPRELRPTFEAPPPRDQPPRGESELFARSGEPYFYWERHRLRLRHGQRTLALAMGLRTGDEWRWWEACRMVVEEDTPQCRTVAMGGAIPLVHSHKTEASGETYRNPWLHKHHWLYGHLRLRMHANGVCEVFARHVNSSYVDDGDNLKPAVPVIGLWTEEAADIEKANLAGPWDGTRDSFQLGDIAFDVTETARLATPEKPGRMDVQDNLLIWQPYQGCELFGGICATQRAESDGYILRAQDETILRGMSRTLRFSLSLSNRSPRVVRFLAPDWWYGLCEEFTPTATLPVRGGTEESIMAARDWIRQSTEEGGFEDGSVARGGKRRQSGDKLEPGWEGEIPYALFLSAWRYGDAEDHQRALRSAYHFSDVVVDHAAKLVRMHGYPPIAFALPMNRLQGTLAAFLETGDDFLLDTAEKVVEAANRQHHNAWPRMAVGRDACYIRSAVMLYRYTGYRHFRDMALKGSLTVAQSQRENGSFGDQGGGSGIHQWSGYITKPWMGLLAINGLIDYLEVVGPRPELEACVKRFADWLMAERTQREGALTWGYQHDYRGERLHQQNQNAPIVELPSKSIWHQDNLARLMGYCALRYNRSEYLEAWAESFAAAGLPAGDHSSSASLQFLPWIQSALWQAVPDPTGLLNLRAVWHGQRTMPAATIRTPEGPRDVCWESPGRMRADPATRLDLRLLP